MTGRRQPQLMQVAAAAATALAVALVGAAPAEASAKPKRATSISGVIWTDSDGDGTRDAGEALVAGAKVTISRQSGKRFKTTKTLTSTKQGRYSYTVRRSGKFRVAVALPTGFAAFSTADQGSDRTDSDLTPAGLSSTLTVRAGGASKRIDGGLRLAPPPAPTAPLTQPLPPAPAPGPAPPEPEPPAPTTPAPTTPAPTTLTVAIGDIVWADSDADGRRDPGEPGLVGVRVELLSADGTRLDSTRSDSTGAFSFIATIGTVYRLRADLPTGAVFSPKGIGAADTNSDINRTGPATSYSDLFTASETLSKLGIGITSPGTSQLGNLVFRDVDGNGIYTDGFDLPMSGITVNLWNESRSQIIASTTSSSAGAYALQAPRGVNYLLEFVASSFYLVSPQNAGADDSLDSDITVSGPNKGFTALVSVGSSPIGNLDAGFIQPVTLGNFVWDDVDGDGIQDPGEPGLAGITVQLWNATKTFLHSSTVSSATGSYTLLAPGAQSYRIRAVLPSGARFSPKAQGADGLQDSDVNASGPNLGFTDSFTLDQFIILSVAYDVGIIQS